jgi:hypothetical protein
VLKLGEEILGSPHASQARGAGKCQTARHPCYHNPQYHRKDHRLSSSHHRDAHRGEYLQRRRGSRSSFLSASYYGSSCRRSREVRSSHSSSCRLFRSPFSDPSLLGNSSTIPDRAGGGVTTLASSSVSLPSFCTQPCTIRSRTSSSMLTARPK